MNDLKVIPVTGNIVDVFWGEGWENWERIRRTKDKKGEYVILHLAGKQMPKAFKVKLYFTTQGKALQS
jgi:hypothetical protein